MTSVLLEDVTVTFPVFTAKAKSLRSNLLYLGSAGALERDARGVVTISALRGVGFQAGNGDRIALVGRNGSGKTTLLKLLAGIYPPTSGTARVDGRVSPILGTGLGVDEELTGYEAIEYACLLRGIDPGKIPALREDIADFTELRGYLSVPVRTYSAGMKMRLGFAVATAGEPDILLIDENILAGDIFFMDKARERANRMLKTSNLLFLASHGEDILRSTCNKALLLDSGEILAAGPVDDVLLLYHRLEERPRPRAYVAAAARTAEGVVPGEQALSSPSDPVHPVEQAFDAAVRTHWRSDPVRPVAGSAFIGYDFGEGREVEIRGVTLRQWAGDLSGSTCVTSVALQLSNDAFKRDVRTADVFEVEPTIARQRFGAAPSARARYWRLLAMSEPLGGREWAVLELDFDTVPPEDWSGGRAIGSAPASPNVPLEAAFQDSPFSHWTSAEGRDDIKETSWIGWDFGAGRKIEVRSFSLRQWNGGEYPNTIPIVKVQSSNDAFIEDVLTADTVQIHQDTELHSYGVAKSRKARFWRILADSTTDGGHWGVIELRFSEHPVQVSIRTSRQTVGVSG